MWPAAASLLDLPEPPVVVLHGLAVAGGAMVIRMQNASDEAQVARIGSAQLRIKDAALSDLLEHATDALSFSNGAVQLPIPPRVIAVVRLESPH
ncbi:MAG: hypothetical protein IPK16_24000 [Anaerolineales bacterium]|nr:hypothetical protein [Anaerolineales bacterium]